LRYRIGLLGARTVAELEDSGATHIASDLDAVGTILLEDVPRAVAARTE
jgi:hypothetical protein